MQGCRVSALRVLRFRVFGLWAFRIFEGFRVSAFRVLSALHALCHRYSLSPGMSVFSLITAKAVMMVPHCFQG